MSTTQFSENHIESRKAAGTETHTEGVCGIQPQTPISRKAIAAAIAGNALEFYDFIIYAFFAIYIARAFFPLGSEYAGLLASVATYGVGFLTRPVGGVVIGAFADRVGRKPAMILTVLLITVGTIGMAVTPSYASIGVAAPVIIVLCRLLQGIALGGEVGPASALLIEAAPSDKRSLYASWQIASQGLAITVGGMVGVTVSLMLDEPELAAWGWRIPFFVSLLLIPVAVYIRRALPETLEHATSPDAIEPLRFNLRKYRYVLGLCVLVLISSAVTAQVGNYMTTYAIHTLKLRPEIAQTATLVGGIMMFLGALFGGFLADMYGRRVTMFVPRLLLAASIVPLFAWLAAAPDTLTLLIATGCITGLSAISSASVLTAIPELLPTQFRATGTSLAYAIGVAIFGGTAQFTVAWLSENFGAVAPAYYVVTTSLISMVGMWLLPETRDTDI